MKLLAILATLAVTLSLAEGVMVCYFGSWAVYRYGNGKFDVETIDPYICTHLVFGFAGLGSDNRIKVLDPWNELCDNYGKCAYDRFTALKQQNPGLITTLAVGGWNEGSTKYSNMAKDPAARATFISSSIEMLKAHNFDGLDMDWEYPTERGGAPEDKANFVILMGELMAALHAEGLILTAAVSAGKTTIDAAYDVPGFSQNVDLIHIMAYDLHGAWETYTHHHTILYPYSEDTGDNVYLNSDFAVNYWMELGAPASKLVLGLATYGRCWTVDSSANTGMYAPASRPGAAGLYTKTPGYLGYNEMVEQHIATPWTMTHEPTMNEPYALSPTNTWCGYDDPTSLALKASWANQLGLAGVMTWSLETDDFIPLYHTRTFELIRSMHEGFTGAPISTPKPPSTTTRDPNASTTPTEAPTTTTFPTGSPGSHCTEPGINGDNTDCTVYYNCALDGMGGYSEALEHCPDNTLFHADIKICDYNYVVCELALDDPTICPNNCPI